MASGLEHFVTRLADSGVAQPDELRGCTPEEIAGLERDFNLTLPETYRQFLSLMGHSAGKLFAWDHVDAYYPAVMRMLEESRLPRDAPGGGPEEETLLRAVTLPEQALVILGHLDDQYHFITCEGGEDGPVFYFSEEGNPPHQIYGSVLDWLEGWRSGAEEAIRTGYFSKHWF